GRTRLGRAVRRQRARLVARAEPLRRRGVRRPPARHRRRPRRRRGAERPLAGVARMAGLGGGLLPGRAGQGPRAGRRARRHVGLRRRDDVATTGAGRPGRGRLPAAAGRPAAPGRPRGGRDAAAGRHVPPRGPRHHQPRRGHRRSTGPGRADDRRRRAGRPRRDGRRGGARGPRGPRGHRRRRARRSGAPYGVGLPGAGRPTL
ncbi:MAG: SAM-dependent methyltransferase, partial [uncultured Nocardioides sp.]